VGFLAQQSVEKLLKAVLASRGIRFERTHDLTRLAQQLGTAGVELPADVERIAELTPWAVELRYDAPLEWEALDHAAAVALVEAIARWADDIVG